MARKKLGDFLLYPMIRGLSRPQPALFGGDFSSGWRFLNIETVHTVPKKETNIAIAANPSPGTDKNAISVSNAIIVSLAEIINDKAFPEGARKPAGGLPALAGRPRFFTAPCPAPYSLPPTSSCPDPKYHHGPCTSPRAGRYSRCSRKYPSQRTGTDIGRGRSYPRS